MSVKVRIPSPLRRLTDDQAEVELEGATVGEVMMALQNQFPGFRNRLFDNKGQLRRFIGVYVNDKDIRRASGEETPVAPGDVIIIAPAVAGG